MRYSPRSGQLFDGVRGRVLSTLCAADDRLSGGQLARLSNSSRSRTHSVLTELVNAGIVRRHTHPSVMMFELQSNAVGRAIDTLHDDSSTMGEMGAAVQILRHTLPQWTEHRHELGRVH